MTAQVFRTFLVCGCIGVGVSLINFCVNLCAHDNMMKINRQIAADKPKVETGSLIFGVVLNMICMFVFMIQVGFSYENLDKIENANRRLKEQELRAKESARRDADIALLNTLTAFSNQDAAAVSTTIADARAAIDKLHSKSA